MNAGITQEIEKLDDGNYDLWKLQMKSLLICNDLWGFVNGTIEKPIERSELLVWKTKDEKALALIVLAVTRNELRRIKQVETSKSAWDELEKFHNLKIHVKKGVLCRQLCQMRKKPDQTVSQYLDEFIEKVKLLEETGTKVSSDLLTIMLLNSLPQKYENLRISIEAKDDIPRLENLRVLLIKEEKKEEEDERLEENAQLFMKQSAESSQNTSLLTEETKSSNENMRQENREVKFEGRCYVCGNYGHRAVNCRDKQEAEKKENNGDSEQVVIQPKVAWALKGFSGEEWHLDIGVTTHISNDKKIGNNNGDGSVLIDFNVNENRSRVRAGRIMYERNLKNNLYSVPRLLKFGHTLKFHKNRAILQDEDGTTRAIAEMIYL